MKTNSSGRAAFRLTCTTSILALCFAHQLSAQENLQWNPSAGSQSWTGTDNWLTTQPGPPPTTGPTTFADGDLVTLDIQGGVTVEIAPGETVAPGQITFGLNLQEIAGGTISSNSAAGGGPLAIEFSGSNDIARITSSLEGAFVITQSSTPADGSGNTLLLTGNSTTMTSLTVNRGAGGAPVSVVNSNLVSGTLTNRASFQNTGTVAGNVTNEFGTNFTDGGTFSNAGTIQGSVTNSAVFVTSGTVTGNITNASGGQLTVSGAVGGNVTSAGIASAGDGGPTVIGGNLVVTDETFSINGPTRVDGNVQVTAANGDRGSLEVAGGNLTAVGGVANAGDIRVGVQNGPNVQLIVGTGNELVNASGGVVEIGQNGTVAGAVNNQAGGEVRLLGRGTNTQATIDGTVNTSGLVVGSGRITGNVTVQSGGEVRATGGLLLDSVLTVNANGTVNVNGGSIRAEDVNNSGTVNVGVAGGPDVRLITDSGQTFNNLGNGVLNVAGNGTVESSVLNSQFAQVNLAGRITGDLITDGVVTASGTSSVGGNVQINGTGRVTSTGDLTVTGSVTVARGTSPNGGQLDVNAGTTSANGLANSGVVNIGATGTGAPAATLRMTGGRVENRSGGELNIRGSGTLRGNVTNDDGGELNLAGGEIVGTVDNSGEMNARGLVTGAVTTTSTGELNVTGGLEITGALTVESDANGTDRGIVNVFSGDLQTGSVRNAGTVRVRGSAGNTRTLTVGTDGAGTFANNARGVLELQNNATLDGALTNARNANATVSDSTVTGLVTNDGTLTSTNGVFQGGIVNNDTGLVDLSGTVQVTGRFDNTGTVVVAGGITELQIQDDATGQSRFTNDGELSLGTTPFTIRADEIVLNTNTTVNGINAVSNTDLIAIGNLTNAGTFAFDSAQTLQGDFRNTDYGDSAANTGRADVNASINFNANNLTNENVMSVSATGTLTNIATLTNSDNARFTIANGRSVEAAQIVNTGSSTFVMGANSVVQAGTFLNQNGSSLQMNGATLNGDLVNSSAATLAGTVNGRIQADGGTIGLTGNLNVNGALDVNRGGGAFGRVEVRGGDLTVASATNDGVVVISDDRTLTVSGAGAQFLNENDGDLTVNGTLSGTLVNEGDVFAAGDFVGTVTNNVPTSRLFVEGDTSITGRLTNLGDVQVRGGNLAVESVASAGTFVLQDDLTLTVTGGEVLNGSTDTQSGNMTLAGTVIGNVTNDVRASLELTGRIQGNLTNRGDTSVQGGTAQDPVLVSGNVVHQGTTFSLEGALTVGGTFTNAAATGAPAFTIGGGDSLTATRFINDVSGQLNIAGGTLDAILDNSGLATLGNNTTLDQLVINRDIGTFVATGTSALDGGFENAGIARFDGDSLISGGFTNTGNATFSGALVVEEGLSNSNVLTVGNGAQIAGGAVNNGLVDMSDGATGDTLEISGGLSGNGFYALDLALPVGDPAVGTADTIEVVGGGVTGNLTFNLNGIAAGDGSGTIRIVDVDDSFANDYTFFWDGTGIDPQEQLVYGLSQDVSGDLFFVAQVNAGLPGISGNVVLTQSLIGSVINRPSSPFVTGLAYEDEDPCGYGAWGRAVGGQADATGSTFNGTNRFPSSISADYAGIQLGADFACFGGMQGGWDLAVGGILGINNGSTTQPVFPIDPNNAGSLLSDPTSINNGDFDQYYAGIYLSGARGPLAFDLQYRLERTDFTLDNVGIGTNPGLGLTDYGFSSDANTLSGSVSYAFPIGETNLTFVPTAGFAWTRTSTDDVVFDNGARLVLEDSESRTGFIGATLARTVIGEDGTSAFNQFVTATAYKDFAGDLTSIYIPTSGEAEFLSSSNLGQYYELSAGVNYVKILEPGRFGNARQMNASLRADYRTGDTLDSWGLTAQFRLQF